MNSDAWTDILIYSFGRVFAGVVEVLPNLIIGIILVILGWIIGAALSKAIEHIFKTVKIDKALSASGLEELLSKGGIKLNSGKFVGELVKWFIIIIFLMTSFDILNLEQVNSFLGEVVIAYIPNVLASVLILLVSVVIADALRKTVVASSKAAGIHSANLLGAITKWLIWIFAGLAILFQLGIGAIFIQTFFTGVVVAFAIAFGLAFGLGGKESAKDCIDKIRKEISSHDTN
jgi:hypothetical protein